MWRTSRPRTPRKAIAAIAATLVTAGGVTAIGVGAASAGPGGPASLNCPTGTVATVINLGGIKVCAAALNVQGTCPASFPIKIQIPGLVAVCVKFRL